MKDSCQKTLTENVGMLGDYIFIDIEASKWQKMQHVDRYLKYKQNVQRTKDNWLL